MLLYNPIFFGIYSTNTKDNLNVEYNIEKEMNDMLAYIIIAIVLSIICTKYTISIIAAIHQYIL